MTANRHLAQLPLVLHMFDNNDGAISIIEIEFNSLIFKLSATIAYLVLE